eukprot:3439472-Amphidinium_carterae.1
MRAATNGYCTRISVPAARCAKRTISHSRPSMMPAFFSNTVLQPWRWSVTSSLEVSGPGRSQQRWR